MTIRHSLHDFSAVARCLPGLLLLSDFLESNSCNTHESTQLIIIARHFIRHSRC